MLLAVVYSEELFDGQSQEVDYQTPAALAGFGCCTVSFAHKDGVDANAATVKDKDTVRFSFTSDAFVLEGILEAVAVELWVMS